VTAENKQQNNKPTESGFGYPLHHLLYKTKAHQKMIKMLYTAIKKPSESNSDGLASI
jgi:hypothetical protein